MSYFAPCYNPCPVNICPTTKSMKMPPSEKKKIRKENALASELMDAKSYSAFNLQNEFLDQTETRVMYREVRRLVNCAKAAQLDDLNLKRERLRAFLAVEDEGYEREFQSLISRRIEEDIAQRKEHLSALTHEREEKRLKMVERMQLKQIVNNSESLRTEIQHQLLMGSKRDQLAQIEERKAMKAIEKDIECMWHEIGIKRLTDQNREEQEKQSVALINSKCCEEELKRQIALKKQREQDEVHDDQRMCCVKSEMFKEDKERPSIQRQKCIQHAEDLVIQAEEKRKDKERIQSDIDQLEASIVATCKSEIAKEEAALRENKKIRYTESVIYLNYLKSMKCERKLNEIELDKLIEELNLKLLEEQRTSRCAVYAKRRAFEKVANGELKQQILDRAQARRNDSNTRLCEAIVERELNTQLISKDREAVLKRFLERTEHAKFLLHQAKETAKIRADAEQRQADELQRIQHEQSQREEKAKALFRGQADALFPVHPNKRLIDHFKSQQNSS